MLTGSSILVADDEPFICELLRDLLEPEGAQVRMVSSGAEALKAIGEEEPDLAILDVRMPEPDGLEILSKVRERDSDIPVIIITAQESSTITIEAMQRGAYDYVAKPFNPDTVLLVVKRALEYRRLTRRVRALEKQAGGKDPRDILIGRSGPMQEVYKLIGRVANSAATILITGDSGTGKELVAQVIHRTSPRSEGPFVVVNCAALPETLLESELFGHEKGAFTGAMAQRKGRFEQASKGSIFLDEIGEMSLSTQKKLLRVLQERSFERVGGNVTVKTDVRVIAATNRDLAREVSEGRFREDLYYRLNVITIHMPRLCERKDDIPLLVQHFVSRKSRRSDGAAPRISDEAMEQLLNYDWPGNVRQLENTIERAMVLSQGRLIGPEHLLLPNDDRDEPHDLLASALTELLDSGEHLETILHQVRDRLVTLAVRRHAGDIGAAAQALGIPEDEIERGVYDA